MHGSSLHLAAYVRRLLQPSILLLWTAAWSLCHADECQRRVDMALGTHDTFADSCLKCEALTLPCTLAGDRRGSTHAWDASAWRHVGVRLAGWSGGAQPLTEQAASSARRAAESQHQIWQLTVASDASEVQAAMFARCMTNARHGECSAARRYQSSVRF